MANYTKILNPLQTKQIEGMLKNLGLYINLKKKSRVQASGIKIQKHMNLKRNLKKN
jgi:hypothetical protein